MTDMYQNHDGYIIVTTDAGKYIDTVANFTTDFGQAPPALPAGMIEERYVPLKLHIYSDGSSQTSAGTVQWAFGDSVIAAYSTLITKQATRVGVPPEGAPAWPAPRDWLGRLSQDKQDAIFAAAASNPQLLGLVFIAAGGPTVNVADPKTIAGVNAFVTAGVLVQADADLLLQP